MNEKVIDYDTLIQMRKDYIKYKELLETRLNNSLKTSKPTKKEIKTKKKTKKVVKNKAKK
jgi:hypothetical protein